MSRLPERTKPLDRGRSFLGAAAMGMFMLASRCLGLLRDINTASVMGLSGSLAMDAFACAFRVPNIARRFFEEGIFGLTFIPVFSQYLKTDRRAARRLAARYLANGLLLGLGAALFLELTAAGAWLIFRPAEGKLWYNILRFGSLMFPYLVFVVPAAQAAAVLQGLGRFRMAGFMPLLFNLIWLAVLYFVSPLGIYLPMKIAPCTLSVLGVSAATLHPAGRGAVLSLSIAGISAVQFLTLLAYLRWLRRRAGETSPFFASFVSPEKIREIRTALRAVWRRLAPVALVIFFLQLNMLLATLLAVLFSGSSVPLFSAVPGVDALFAGTTGRGAASALYFGERLYEFPLSLVGVTVGTAFYPLLSRRALEKDRSGYAVDFTAALRLVVLLAIPSGIGLALLANPLSNLFFAHGAASAADSARIARITFCFACGVPAFCLTAFLNRALMAISDLRTPLLAGMISIPLFLAAALLGVHTLGEGGLALAVSLASWGQAALLLRRARREISSAEFRLFTKTFLASAAASAVMGLGIAAERIFLHGSALITQKMPVTSASAGLAADLAAGITLFFLVILFLDPEWGKKGVRLLARRIFGRKEPSDR